MHFLYQHFSENTGAILGDDMGLGKTVQVRNFSLCINIILSLSELTKFSHRILGKDDFKTTWECSAR